MHAKRHPIDLEYWAGCDADGHLTALRVRAVGDSGAYASVGMKVLERAAVGPEHAWLHDQKRVEYGYATDDKALEAFMKLARLEGIIPALEPAHALAKLADIAPKKPKDHIMVLNMSGRGDKDLQTLIERLAQ